MSDQINTPSGHILCFLAVFALGMLGEYLKMPTAHDVIIASLTGLLVTINLYTRTDRTDSK